MPGAYLLAILLSAAGIAALDARFRLAFWRDGRRTLIAVLIGTAYFLVWDAAGIATGVFAKGGSALLLGIQLAPELPLEEPFFLAFLCYLALVVHGAALRLGRRPADARQARHVPKDGR
jgi:lycopene cyclase domain-containing protein